MIECRKVTFMAYGMEHRTYTTSFSFEQATEKIKELSDTALVLKSETVVVEQSIYEDFNISKMVEFLEDIRRHESPIE